MNHHTPSRVSHSAAPGSAIYDWDHKPEGQEGDAMRAADTACYSAADHVGITTAICVGLIDCNSFSRDCVARGLTSQQDINVIPFESTQGCITSTSNLDLVVYYSHSDGPFDLAWARDVTSLQTALGKLPIIIISDALTATEASTVRNALKAGIRGYISTQTTDVAAVAAAIRFVKAGGTFAPVDLLLASGYDRGRTRNETLPGEQLTARQLTVLSHLRQGKANKTIAYELGMSESTVKIHIRNIMRKTGATNRTQAVYRSQQIASDGAGA